MALTNDHSVEMEKGPGRPVNMWSDRAEVLRSLKCVHSVVPTRNLFDALYMLRPRILVKGIDWKDRLPQEIRDACGALDIKIVFTTTPKMSSTEIITRCRTLATTLA